MAHHQWKRFLCCMPAAADGNHGGDVGLAAQAAATRGSRPYGLSPPLRGDRGPLGLSPHTNQLWVVITTLSCAVGTNKSVPAGAFVLLRRAMPGRLLGDFALHCFGVLIGLSGSHLQDALSCCLAWNRRSGSVICALRQKRAKPPNNPAGIARLSDEYPCRR